MSRVLPDLSQKSVQRQFLGHTHIDRGGLAPEPGRPFAVAPRDPSRFVEHEGREVHGKRVIREGRVVMPSRWNRLSFEPVHTGAEQLLVEQAFQRPKPPRQHLAQKPRNVQRLYRPQDQRGVQSVFVIMDRKTGQVLARVRGSAAHCEIEAEKLARSQACELADLKVVFEGELA